MLGTGVHPKANANPPKAKQLNPRWVLSETLLKACQDYSPRNRYLTETELGRFLGEMGCEHKSNGKKWGWVFPPLAEARSAWLARVGGAWEFECADLAEWLGEA